MAKFDRKSRGPARRESEEGEKKSGRSAYKAKRSFTRNKSYRSKENSDEKRAPYRGDDRVGFRDRGNKKEQRGEKSGYRDRPTRKKDGDERPAWKSEDAQKPRRSEREPDGRNERSGYRDKPYRKKDGDDRSPRKREDGEKPRRSERESDGRRNDERSDYRDKPFRRKNSDDRNSGDREDRARPRKYDREDGEHRSAGRQERERRSGEDRRAEGGEKRDAGQRGDREKSNEGSARRGYREDGDREKKRSYRDDKPERREPRRSFDRDRDDHAASKRRGGDGDEPRRVKHSDFEEGRAFTKREERKAISPKKSSDDGLVRLNKYLANSGVSSRREADTLIQSGAVKVNGVVVDQLGYKIKPTDTVTYGDAPVKGERKVYLLLNKPKDYITTVDDPRERRTVMELIKGACRERVYPVGRLDRNTTGLLLFTNDGELTTKLTHPKYGVKKVYHVSLDKSLKTTDFKALTEGIELEDGIAKADDLAFVGEGKRDVGIEIHSGRNRIVRRMFEHLGYKVIKLDRVVFAGLTKKDLPRGKHRFLTGKEISFLKMIG